MDEHEEFEHIPWSELSAAGAAPRSKTLLVAAGLVGAIVLGVLAGRAFGGGPATSEPVGESAAADDPAAAAGTTTSVAVTTTVALPELPGLYSEADLMAIPPVGPERAAATRAEWFVYDYFTADMEPTGTADVVSSLPAGAELPEMPQDTVSSLSYVEWARAFRVHQVGDDAYRVGVVFRMLGAPPDRGFFRLEARAVEVLVVVSADGGSVVADLPSPISVPAAPEPEPWPASGDETAPSLVVDQAIVLARAWGDEPRLIDSQQIDGGWRIVMSVADEVGNRWPVALRVDGNGDRIL